MARGLCKQIGQGFHPLQDVKLCYASMHVLSDLHSIKFKSLLSIMDGQCTTVKKGKKKKRKRKVIEGVNNAPVSRYMVLLEATDL